MRAALLVAAAALAACRVTPVGLTDPHARAIEDSVRTTFADYVARFNARDVDSVVRFYSAAPDFQWIEDGQPRYASRAEVRRALDGLAAYRDVRLSVDPPRIVALAAGAASIAVTFDQSLVDSNGGGTGFVGAITIAAVRTPAGWKWRAGHTSVRRDPITTQRR